MMDHVIGNVTDAVRPTLTPKRSYATQHRSPNQSRALRPFFCTAFEPANAVAKTYENHQ
jgi:hypothetical protein